MATCTLSTSTSLIILYAIVLAEASLDIVSEKTTFEVGDTIVINCSTVSHSAQSVQWFFNSNPIPEKQYTVFSADLSQLVIPYSNFSNAGNYSCALLEASFEEIATVQIQVGEKPHPVSSFNCFSFNGVDILCTWDDGGPTNIPTTSTLMYKGLYAAPSKPGYDWTACPDSGTSVNCPDLHSYTHSCFIYGYDHHCGSRHNFTVIAENALGTAATWIWFNPEAEAVPFAPSNTTAVAESGECVAVSWDYPCGWEHPEYVGYFSLQYRLRYKSQWDADKWGNLISQEYKKEKRVCQLEGYTHYSIQLSAGLTGQTKYWSHWSDIIVVRTLEQAPVKGVTLSEDWQFHDCDYSPNKRNVSISWEVPESKYLHGKLQRYEVKFWYQDTESDVTVIERNASDTSMVIEDMSRWKSLNIDVYTCNSAGCTGSIKPIRLDAVKVAREAPLNVSAFETCSSSFNVTWARPDNDECIKSYNVRYTSEFYRGKTEVTDQYAHIPNVPSGSEYTVSVSANIYKGYDLTDKSEPRSTTVRILAPVKGVTLSKDWQFHDCDYSPHKKNISISWEVPQKQYWQGKLLRYEIQFWYEDTQSNVTVIERNESDSSMMLEDMSRWKSLNIDVYTCNSASCTGSAKPIRLDDVKVARDAPLNVSAFETSSSSFNVTWARPDNDECIKSYNVRYTSELHQGETDVTDQYAHITHLPSGTEYTVSLSANIYKGYDSTDESEPRSTTVRLHDENWAIIVTSVLVPLMILCFCTLYYCRKHRVFIYEHCFKSIRRQDFREHMDGVLNDRPVAPSYDESFQYDTLNGTLTSTLTYHINASISVASVTESSPSTDINGKSHNFEYSSANIITGTSENVPLPSLEDILISPPTPDDNSSTIDIELIEGNFLDRSSENLRSPNDSSNGVNTYATLRFMSAGGGDVGADTQQASSSSDETRSMSQHMCGEAEESERLQHMPAGSDNSGVQYEDGNITSDRVGMIDTFENKFSVISHLKESIGVNSCKFDTNQSPKVKDDWNESLNSEVEINPIKCIGPLMGLDLDNLLGVQDFSSGSWENDNPTFEPYQPNDVGNGKSNTASNNGTDISDYVQSQLHKKLAMDSNQNDSYFPTRAINNNNPPNDNIIDLHSILDIPKEGNTSEEKQMGAQRIETSTDLTVPTLKESLDIDPQDSDNMVNMGAPTCCQPNQTSNLDYVAQRETINLSSTESNYGDHAQQGIEIS